MAECLGVEGLISRGFMFRLQCLVRGWLGSAQSPEQEVEGATDDIKSLFQSALPVPQFNIADQCPGSVCNVWLLDIVVGLSHISRLGF